jgi:hypothetical protein
VGVGTVIALISCIVGSPVAQLLNENASVTNSAAAIAGKIFIPISSSLG